ncbi:MAG: paraquat-inducible membrane protein A [Gammaproteobacteria bacterium]|nr:MAG: paraquat-inducible membrane protein A [Gammaproteobacteria bacterium]
MSNHRAKKANIIALFDAPTAKAQGKKVCGTCRTLMPVSEPVCPLCYARVLTRKPQSLSSTMALLFAAILLFFPANFLPTMTTNSALLGEKDDTIWSGIVYLWHHGDKPIAAVVFVASIVTPIFKMASIAYLCFSCYRRSSKHIIFRTKLYHFNELIGRWSMIDVFVVALLGALVQMGALGSIEPRVGILAFALVVFFSMLSLQQFDPRLIWDYSHEAELPDATHTDFGFATSCDEVAGASKPLKDNS